VNKKAQAYEAIKAAITALEEELNNRNIPEIGPKSRLQLEEMLRMLRLMEKKLRGEEKIDQTDIYGYGLGRVITDSWPDPGDTLGKLLLNAEQLYVQTMRNTLPR